MRTCRSLTCSSNGSKVVPRETLTMQDLSQYQYIYSEQSCYGNTYEILGFMKCSYLHIIYRFHSLTKIEKGAIIILIELSARILFLIHVRILFSILVIIHYLLLVIVFYFSLVRIISYETFYYKFVLYGYYEYNNKAVAKI